MNYANEFGWVSLAKISLHGTTLVAIADINIFASNQHLMKSVTLVIRASDFAWTVAYLSHALIWDVVSIEAKCYFAFTKIALS